MRQRRPESKYSMQYDKLIIDHEIYMFNDMTGRVEEVSQKIQKSRFWMETWLLIVRLHIYLKEKVTNTEETICRDAKIVIRYIFP